MKLRRYLFGGVLILLPVIASAQDKQEEPIRMSLPMKFLDTTAASGPTVKELKLGPEPFNFNWGGMFITDPPPSTASKATKTSTKSAPTDTRPLRVLFVGNSLTFYNDMPRMFSILAAAGTGRRVEAGVVSFPGAPNVMLWSYTDVGQVIRRIDWDYVVLQLRPDGLKDLTNYTRSIQKFNEAITEPRAGSGKQAKAIFWGQPPAVTDDPRLAPKLDSVFAASAAEVHAPLAPISETWRRVQKADSTAWLGLFYDLSNKEKPNEHPSPMGSYLKALIFYRMITGQSPIGLPGDVGALHLSEAHKTLLQRMAAMP